MLYGILIVLPILMEGRIEFPDLLPGISVSNPQTLYEATEFIT